MKIRVSELRYCNVLPSAKLADFSRKLLTSIRFLPEFYEKTMKWWEFEKHVELAFDEAAGPSDIPKINKTCGSCGLCCKDIPTHQIGIYMSDYELVQAKRMFPEKQITQGMIKSQGANFNVVDVKPNGDCVMLGPEGCTLGDKKPLWCKIYHCEVYQGRDYLFKKGTT